MKFLKHNGLSIVFLVFFLAALAAQVHFGLLEYNKERLEHGALAATFATYLHSGHFWQSTFENWESEFLQMALFVWLTIFLYQKGSSESKKCDAPNDVDRKPDPKRKDAPWPVRKGGWILKIYQHSLTISLFAIFIVSFFIHFYGSLKDENELNLLKGLPKESAAEYLSGSRFWFESFQNWQSEFLSVFAIIVLSIYLRQKGSAQSKPVDAPHSQTGD